MEEGSPLAGILSTKPGLSCSTVMETQFFTCQLGSRQLDICGICGLADVAELLQPGEAEKALYSKVFPICSDCQAKGHEFPHGRKRAGAARQAAATGKKKKRQAGRQQRQQARVQAASDTEGSI